MRETSKVGSVLNFDEIRSRLEEGNIFHNDSWDPECIRGAAYDLRMADDVLVVPDPPEFPSGRRYNRGEKRTKPVILNPGDVAFISTLERLCMPWDLVGIMGPKFSIARRGILMLTGLCVDPGYGLMLDHTGKWTPKEDERLHFLLANVGPEPVVLIPGKQKIAAIQFFKISESRIKPKVIQGVEQDFFDPITSHGAGLAFFRNMADVRQEVINFGLRIEQFDQLVGQNNQRLSSLETSSNQILMFGVYLLCATILGVSIAVIFSLLTSLKVELNWVNAIVLCVGFVVLGWIVSSIMSFLRSRLNENQNSRSRT